MYQALFHKIYESGATLFIINMKNLLENIQDPSSTEREAYIEGRSYRYYRNSKRKPELKQFFAEYENESDINLLYNYDRCGLRPVFRNGIHVLADTSSTFYNVINGRRVTYNNPSSVHKTIHVFGNCNAVSCFAEDKFTFASQLQDIINKNQLQSVQVVNDANWQVFIDVIRQILSPRYKFNKGDIVIIIANDAKNELCQAAINKFQNKDFYEYHDLSSIFQRPHNYGEIIFDHIHMNKNGYAILAKKVFSIIKPKIESENIYVQIPQSMNSYANYLLMLKRKMKNISGVIGSVVMNCNPFTLGHKYLVDEALKRCDYLFVFILDEDKSFFKFEDRIFMVKSGLQKYSNASIVPSGKAVLSLSTLPEYFDKESVQDATIDATYDLHLFSSMIAPILGITKRFAGTEPSCNITSQYNLAMKILLPKHGIDFVEIPRLMVNNAEVSASQIRKWMKEGNVEKAKEFLPQTTFDILMSKYYSNN